MCNFKDNSTCKALTGDLQYVYRRINHALDNYGMDMDKDLREALEELYKATEEVLRCIK